MKARERRVDAFAFRPDSGMLRNYLRGLEADGWRATSLVRTRSNDPRVHGGVVVTAERRFRTRGSARAGERTNGAP
jgi:hypothetical protein